MKLFKFIGQLRYKAGRKLEKLMWILRKESILSNKNSVFLFVSLLLIVLLIVIAAGMDFFHNHENGLEEPDNCPVARLSVIFVFLFTSALLVLFDTLRNRVIYYFDHISFSNFLPALYRNCPINLNNFIT